MKLAKILGISALTLSLALPVAAQTGTNTAPGVDTTGQVTTNEDVRDDDSFDWGWLGLLGLIGLAGLAGKRHADNNVSYRDPAETRSTSTRF